MDHPAKNPDQTAHPGQTESPTKKLRTIIVDDESLALELLRSYLDELPIIEIVAACQNGSEAVNAVMELQPDLIFLDIQMPGLNGFDVIKNLQADILPLVVFVTAYDQYALNAFDVYAVDYILKPIDAQSIARAVDRSIARYTGSHESISDKTAIVGALEQIAEQSNALEPGEAVRSLSIRSNAKNSHIVVKDQGIVNLIDQTDIEWIDAAGDYMCIHALGVTHIMRSTLKDLLEQLNPDTFKRIHRSTIVNLGCIEKIVPHTKGEYFLELRGAEQIKVSRNYRGAIKDFLAGFKSK